MIRSRPGTRRFKRSPPRPRPGSPPRAPRPRRRPRLPPRHRRPRRHGRACTSTSTAASRFGLPDTGLLSLDELAAQARTIANAVALPVIADAEGGFNDPANIWRTVQAFEQSGAAVEARADPNFLIAARSDANWIAGDFEDTVRRLEAYAAAGADLVFPTLVSPAQLAEIRRRVPRPAMIVDIPGGTLANEERAGASIVLYYGFSALVHYDALDRALATFKATRDANAVPGYRERVQAFEDFMG